VDEGGDAACWAHLVAEPDEAIVVDPDPGSMHVGGVVWSLPHGGDLDANLVRLAPGAAIGEHRNQQLDVLVVVREGSGVLEMDGERHALRPGVIALVPRGAARAVRAGEVGIGYLSIHRRRDPLGIGR
jgi:quercetin dioxygenase-like cupin family protein